MAQDSSKWESAYRAYKKKPSYKVPGFTKQWHKPVVKESMVLQQELIEVNKQIKILLQRKKHLMRTLKESGQKQIQSEYFDKHIILYALELEDNCYYIGMSRNVDKRFKKHCSKKGASNWSRLHKPIKVLETRETSITNDSDAAKLEDDMTLEYALKYGSDKVRGGGFCQSKPRWPDLILQNEVTDSFI